MHSDDQPPSLQRPRADSQMTCDTEPSLSQEEKLNLLNSSAFDSDVTGGAAVPKTPSAATRNPSDAVEAGREGSLAVEGNNKAKGGSANAPPLKKRRKTGNDAAITADDGNGGENSGDSSSSSEEDGETGGITNAQKRPHVKLTTKQQEQLDLAKNKLSKWAARLFDPNRPRGLVEAPKVIPLNDEFLTAFGKREKEYDEVSGRVTAIDKTSLDVIDISDDELEDDDRSKNKEAKNINVGDLKKFKVKISNLSYRTTAATIARTCGTIGPVVDVNLILQDNGQSSGRAYVAFEDQETARSCAEKLNQKSMEGRTLYVTLASGSGRRSLDPFKKQDSRYWDRDISRKPDEAVLKPCGLCGEVGHDMWSCPQKSVCFNCGVPGHVSRECNRRRGLPQRTVCTNCYQGRHHRFQCRERPWAASWEGAVCMQCGKRGHLMCSELRWFFGLKGVSCFNCGGSDHNGFDCKRPNINECLQNPHVAMEEISRAGSASLNDQLSDQRSHRESRDGRQNSNGNHRARSMPPPHERGNRDGYSRGEIGRAHV